MAASNFMLQIPIFALPEPTSCITTNALLPPLTPRTVGITIELVVILLLVTVYEPHCPTAIFELERSAVNSAAPEFVDWPEPHKKRHLLRLWLSLPGDRALPPTFSQAYGNLDIGDSGGVVTKETTLHAPIVSW